MRRVLALLAVATLAGLAAWRLLGDRPAGPPARSTVSAVASPRGPSLTAAPSTAGEPSRCEVSAEPTRAATEVPKPARVHGTVYDEDGRPTEAEVQVGALEGLEILASAPSAPDGTFSLEVPAGERTIAAVASARVSGPRRLTVESGQEYAVKLRLGRGATVWGYVTGPDASALPGVAVACSEVDHWVLSRALSDATGMYRLTIPVDPVALRAEREGLAPAIEPIHAIEGEELRRDLQLGDPRTLRGRVVDPEGRAVPGARVELRIDSGRNERVDLDVWRVLPVWRAETDEQGRFALDGLPDRVFFVAAHARSWQQGAHEECRPGMEDLVLVLERGARVTGRVVRKSDGCPVDGTKVWIVWNDLDVPFEAAVGDEGRFALSGMRQGRYVVVAWSKGFAVGESTPFTVAAEGVIEGVRVELIAGGTLRGVVLDESTRAPVIGARIRTTGPSRSDMRRYHQEIVSSMEATSDAEGRFELATLPPGDTRFNLSHPDYQCLNQTAEILDGRVTEATFLLKTGGTIEGKLLVAQGGTRPPHHGRIRLQSESMILGTGTKSDGSFHIDSLRPGKYTLFGVEEAPGRTVVAWREIEVRAGETLRFDLALGCGGRLWGRIHPRTTEALKLRPAAERHSVEHCARVDANGDYELVGVPAGEYEATIGEVTQTITLPEGDYDVRRDFELPLDAGR